MTNLIKKILDYDKLYSDWENQNKEIDTLTSSKNRQETIYKERIDVLQFSVLEKDSKIESLKIKIHESDEQIIFNKKYIYNLETDLDKKEKARHKLACRCGGYQKQINKLKQKLLDQKSEFETDKSKLLKIIDDQEVLNQKYRFLKSKLKSPTIEEYETGKRIYKLKNEEEIIE